MLSLRLGPPAGAQMSVLAIGAHPDDIEIGAGGTLLGMAECHPGLRVRYVVLTGTEPRQLEARAAAQAFLPGADVDVELYSLRDGRLPAAWDEVKDIIEAVGAGWRPDLVLGPSAEDAHQDHRLIGEILPTVFRDSLYLAYELPKWDGDLRRPSMYSPLTEEQALRKVELLNKSFPSQHGRDWWSDELFLGLARMRGVECRSPFAEAFSCAKARIDFGPT